MANRATSTELSADEQAQICAYTWQYLDVVDYRNFIQYDWPVGSTSTGVHSE